MSRRARVPTRETHKAFCLRSTINHRDRCQTSANQVTFARPETPDYVKDPKFPRLRTSRCGRRIARRGLQRELSLVNAAIDCTPGRPCHETRCKQSTRRVVFRSFPRV